MRLISLLIQKDLISIGMSGCNLRCPYCALRDKSWEELSAQDILETIESKSCREIAIAGGEPALQGIELKQLLRKLSGKMIYLKTNGSKPEVIQELMPFVDKFILEIKAPFGDLDACSKLAGISTKEAARYFKSLRMTLSVLQNKSCTIWIRVIPPFINSQNLPDILSNFGKTSEVVLYQFLGNRSLDIPCYGYSSPVPPHSELEFLATVAKKHVEKVVVEARAQGNRCQCCE